MSALGILTHFISFLIILGVAFPPVASIMVVDYFILKTHRKELDESRSSGGLPTHVPGWNVPGVVSWIIAGIVGYYVAWGIASLDALVVAAVAYYVLSKVWAVVRPAVGSGSTVSESV